METVVIAVDVGGTKMRIAAAGARGLESPRKVPTPADADEGIAALVAHAHELGAGRRIAAIAGGIPGVVKDGALVWEPPHLSGWKGADIAGALSRALGVPARFLNDATVVGLGEAREGAGRGSAICAYVTVSTGVNGIRIVNGVPDQATYGFEIGWQLVGEHALGELVSGLAVEKRFGIAPKDLASEEERARLADILAIGLFNTTLHWSPDTIVLGGSMIVGMNPIPLPRVEMALAKRLTMYPEPPLLKMAQLRDDGGLIGAMHLARDLLSGRNPL